MNLFRTWTTVHALLPQLIVILVLVQCRNINLQTIDLLQLGQILGSTNPVMMIIVQETFLIRPKGFTPFFLLLTPEFSLQFDPANLTTNLLLKSNAALPVSMDAWVSVRDFSPVHYPRIIPR
jgi:hypothetical protein